MIVNYDSEFEKILKSIKISGKKVLLQVCCAPCFSGVYERFDGVEYSLYFYNPNITDKQEYEKRLSELRRFSFELFGDEKEVIDGGFDGEAFFQAVKGLEDEKEGGKRCKSCYALRLDKTAELSKRLGFDYFATTLTVSPYKNAAYLNECGFLSQQKTGVLYLPSDFKKRGGYAKSIENSKKYGLYRQNYCGCVFSKKAREDYEKSLHPVT